MDLLGSLMGLLGSLVGLLGSLMKLLGAMDDPVAGKHSCGEIGCPGMGKTVVYRRKLLVQRDKLPWSITR